MYTGQYMCTTIVLTSMLEHWGRKNLYCKELNCTCTKEIHVTQ